MCAPCPPGAGDVDRRPAGHQWPQQPVARCRGADDHARRHGFRRRSDAAGPGLHRRLIRSPAGGHGLPDGPVDRIGSGAGQDHQEQPARRQRGPCRQRSQAATGSAVRRQEDRHLECAGLRCPTPGEGHRARSPGHRQGVSARLRSGGRRIHGPAAVAGQLVVERGTRAAGRRRGSAGVPAPHRCRGHPAAERHHGCRYRHRSHRTAGAPRIHPGCGSDPGVHDRTRRGHRLRLVPGRAPPHPAAQELRGRRLHRPHRGHRRCRHGVRRHHFDPGRGRPRPDPDPIPGLAGLRGSDRGVHRGPGIADPGPGPLRPDETARAAQEGPRRGPPRRPAPGQGFLGPHRRRCHQQTMAVRHRRHLAAALDGLAGHQDGVRPDGRLLRPTRDHAVSGQCLDHRGVRRRLQRAVGSGAATQPARDSPQGREG